MAETTTEETNGGSHWLRWLVLAAIVIAAIVIGRQKALEKSDQEFEQRLADADRAAD